VQLACPAPSFVQVIQDIAGSVGTGRDRSCTARVFPSVGLSGFKDSWLAPYAWTILYEEIAGGVLLLASAGALCFSGKAGR
jgi:hypothetical protein